MLSHNLYTVLNIPHDPVALEEHFRDDDDGPVSSQGYMPYLNKYILDKVRSSWGAPLPTPPSTLTPCLLPKHSTPLVNSHFCPCSLSLLLTLQLPSNHLFPIVCHLS